MSELLIPFGIHRETGAMVEPEDAPKGRACNCLCPGCKAPVLSRHPRKNRYHFAHDSRHELAKPEQECPFSSAVAVAMMIRELAPSLGGKAINTPDYQRILKHPCCDLRHDWVQISHSSTVKIAEASSDADKFDLKLIVGGYPILIDLIYKGKPRTALVEADLQAAKAGVLALDCDSFLLSSLRKNRNQRFSEAVADFVLKTGKKKWRYHPRQAAKLQVSRESHQCRRGYKPVDIRKPVYYPMPAAPTRVIQPRPAKPKPPPKKKQPSKRYHCVLCDLEWVHDFSEPLSCPGCHSHLYAKDLGAV